MTQYQSIHFGQTQEIQCPFASSECLCAYGMYTEILQVLMNKNVLKSFIFLNFWDYNYIYFFLLLSPNTFYSSLFPFKFLASVSLPLHFHIHTYVFLYLTWSVCILALVCLFSGLNIWYWTTDRHVLPCRRLLRLFHPLSFVLICL